MPASRLKVLLQRNVAGGGWDTKGAPYHESKVPADVRAVATRIQTDEASAESAAEIGDGPYPYADLKVSGSQPIIQEEIGSGLVGCRLQVYWPDDAKWYAGYCTDFSSDTEKHTIVYDDSTSEQISLRVHAIIYVKQVVWAKMKGFPWWPAQVIHFNSPMGQEHRPAASEYVIFFNSGDASWIPRSSIKQIDEMTKPRKNKQVQAAHDLALEAVAKWSRMQDAYRRKASIRLSNQLTGFDWISRFVEINDADLNYSGGALVVAKVLMFCPFTNKHLLRYLCQRPSSVSTSQTGGTSKGDLAMKYAVADKVKWVKLDRCEPSYVDPMTSPVVDRHAIAQQPTSSSGGSAVSPVCGYCELPLVEEQLCVGCTQCSKLHHFSCLLNPPGKRLRLRRNATFTDGVLVATNTDWTCLRCTTCFGCRVHSIKEDLVEVQTRWQGYDRQTRRSVKHFPGATESPIAEESGSTATEAAAAAADEKEKLALPDAIVSLRLRGRFKFRSLGLGQGWSTVDIKADGAGRQPVCGDCLSKYKNKENCPICGRLDDGSPMIACDTCKMWVHRNAHCAPASGSPEHDDDDGYLWKEAFICAGCRTAMHKQTLQKLANIDKVGFFALPVTEEIAPGYFDKIKEPMDLSVMRERVEDQHDYYRSDPSLFRYDFALICANALDYNTPDDPVWRHAKRFYEAGCVELDKVFWLRTQSPQDARVRQFLSKRKQVQTERQQLAEDYRAKIQRARATIGPPVRLPCRLPTFCRPRTCIAPLVSSDWGLGAASDGSSPSCVAPDRANYGIGDDALVLAATQCQPACQVCGSCGESWCMMICSACGEASHSFCVEQQLKIYAESVCGCDEVVVPAGVASATTPEGSFHTSSSNHESVPARDALSSAGSTEKSQPATASDGVATTESVEAVPFFAIDTLSHCHLQMKWPLQPGDFATRPLWHCLNCLMCRCCSQPILPPVTFDQASSGACFPPGIVRKLKMAAPVSAAGDESPPTDGIAKKARLSSSGALPKHQGTAAIPGAASKHGRKRGRPRKDSVQSHPSSASSRAKIGATRSPNQEAPHFVACVCAGCGCSYHSYCLDRTFRAYGLLPNGKPSRMFCGACVACAECGTKNSDFSKWSPFQHRCLECATRQEREEKRRREEERRERAEAAKQAARAAKEALRAAKAARAAAKARKKALFEAAEASAAAREEQKLTAPETPPSNPLWTCYLCNSVVGDADPAVECESCRTWIHRRCEKISDADWARVTVAESLRYFCPQCRRTSRRLFHQVGRTHRQYEGLVQMHWRDSFRTSFFVQPVPPLPLCFGSEESLPSTVDKNSADRTTRPTTSGWGPWGQTASRAPMVFRDQEHTSKRLHMQQVATQMFQIIQCATTTIARMRAVSLPHAINIEKQLSHVLTSGLPLATGLCQVGHIRHAQAFIRLQRAKLAAAVNEKLKGPKLKQGRPTEKAAAPKAKGTKASRLRKLSKQSSMANLARQCTAAVASRSPTFCGACKLNFDILFHRGMEAVSFLVVAFRHAFGLRDKDGVLSALPSSLHTMFHLLSEQAGLSAEHVCSSGSCASNRVLRKTAFGRPQWAVHGEHRGFATSASTARPLRTRERSQQRRGDEVPFDRAEAEAVEAAVSQSPPSPPKVKTETPEPPRKPKSPLTVEAAGHDSKAPRPEKAQPNQSKPPASAACRMSPDCGGVAVSADDTAGKVVTTEVAKSLLPVPLVEKSEENAASVDETLPIPANFSVQPLPFLPEEAEQAAETARETGLVDLSYSTTLSRYPPGHTGLSDRGGHKCHLCRLPGDRRVEGRLLPARLKANRPTVWVHVNCAIWTPEVQEDRSGILHRVRDACRRSRGLSCTHCNQIGASIGCQRRHCRRNFHYNCGSASGGVFFSTKQLFCAAHCGELVAKSTNTVAPTSDLDDGGGDGQSNGDHTRSIAAQPALDAIFPITSHRHDRCVMLKNGDLNPSNGLGFGEPAVGGGVTTTTTTSDLWNMEDPSTLPYKNLRLLGDGGRDFVRIGALVIVSFGRLQHLPPKTPQELRAFHDENFIFPPGFTALRTFWSWDRPVSSVLLTQAQSSDATKGPALGGHRKQEVFVLKVVNAGASVGPLFVVATLRAWLGCRGVVPPAQARGGGQSRDDRDSGDVVDIIVAKSAKAAMDRFYQRFRDLNDNDEEASFCAPHWMTPELFFGFGYPVVNYAIEHSAKAIFLGLPRKMRQSLPTHGLSDSDRKNGEEEEGEESSLYQGLDAGLWWPQYRFHWRKFGSGAVQTALNSMRLAVTRSAAVLTGTGCARADPWVGGGSAHGAAEENDDTDTSKRSGAGSGGTTPAKKARLAAARRQLRKINALSAPTSGPSGAGSSSSGNLRSPHAAASSSQGSSQDPDEAAAAAAAALAQEPDYLRYAEMRRIPQDDRVSARKSSIHGWGVFLERPFKKDQFIVEYTGEAIRLALADEREKRYALQHETGGCYMFRMDEHWIVDATRKGNVARFTNHSCEPNVNAVVIPKDKHRTEKAIVFYALKDLDVGDEITYDYKFAFEDGTDTIHCNCGASMCRGRMN